MKPPHDWHAGNYGAGSVCSRCGRFEVYEPEILRTGEKLWECLDRQYETGPIESLSLAALIAWRAVVPGCEKVKPTVDDERLQCEGCGLVHIAERKCTASDIPYRSLRWYFVLPEGWCIVWVHCQVWYACSETCAQRALEIL